MENISNIVFRVVEKNYTLFLAFFILLAGFNLFFMLGEPPVFDWDESRHGVSAYEMIINNNFIKNTYLNEPDYWNLKPPLGLWLISLSYVIFGFNVFALRFWSAFFGFLTILIVIQIARKILDKWSALFSVGILSTYFSFIGIHSARTGDFDSMLIFLITLTALLMMGSEEKKIRLYLSGLLFSLSFLLKSFASVQIILVIVIYYILTGYYKKLKFLDLVLFLLFSSIPILTWVFFRYLEDGFTFFEKMLLYDFVERTSKSIEGHRATLMVYVESVILKGLPWSIILILAISYRNRLAIKWINKLGLYLTFDNFLSKKIILSWAIPILLASGIVKTKTEWYIFPIIPLISLYISWFLSDNIKSGKKHFLVVFLVVWLTAQAIVSFLLFSPWAKEKLAESYNTNKLDLQKLIYSLPEARERNSNKLYSLVNLRQSEVFLSEVVKGYKIIITNNIDLADLYEGDAILADKSILERFNLDKFETFTLKDKIVIVRK